MSMSSADAEQAASAIPSGTIALVRMPRAKFLVILWPLFFPDVLATDRGRNEDRRERDGHALRDLLRDARLGVVGGRGYLPQRIPAVKATLDTVLAVDRTAGNLVRRALAHRRR